MPAVDQAALDTLFLDARTHNSWSAEPVTDDTIRELYEILKHAPTSANASPGRFLFIRTPEAKERLRPALSAGNTEKTMAAPVTVIVAYDPKFYDHLPRLFPHTDARSWYAQNEELAETTAFRNGTLAGRLSHHGRARAWARLRRDVGFRQCEGRHGVPRRSRLEVELPGQSRVWRTGRRAPEGSPLRV